MSKKRVAIGIDLGTSKCCVAVVRPNGKAEVIENERGNRTTPSYVAFTDEERLIGEAARDQLAYNPANTVYGVKRLMGLNYDNIDDICKKYPFSVRNEDNKPVISVSYRNEDVILTPEQISAMLLKKMKVVAEKHLECTVEDAVITVPAHFNNEQRKATITAAALADLNVLSLISESTAAGIAYVQDKQFNNEESIVIFDFGGGFLEVGHFNVSNKFVRQLNVSSDTFGGIDLNHYISDILVEHIKKKYNVSVSFTIVEQAKIDIASEKVKHAVSLVPKASVNVESLYKDFDFVDTVFRYEFEGKTDTFVNELLREVLEKIQVSSGGDNVHKVVLVGGSSRIPSIQKILCAHFQTSRLNKTINMDEAVAIGAAIAANSLITSSSSYKIFDNGKSLQEHMNHCEKPSEHFLSRKQLQAFENFECELERNAELVNELESRCNEIKKIISERNTYFSENSLINIDELIRESDGFLVSVRDNKILSQLEVEQSLRLLSCLKNQMQHEKSRVDEGPSDSFHTPSISNIGDDHSKFFISTTPQDPSRSSSSFNKKERSIRTSRQNSSKSLINTVGIVRSNSSMDSFQEDYSKSSDSSSRRKRSKSSINTIQKDSSEPSMGSVKKVRSNSSIGTIKNDSSKSSVGARQKDRKKSEIDFGFTKASKSDTHNRYDNNMEPNVSKNHDNINSKTSDCKSMMTGGASKNLDDELENRRHSNNRKSKYHSTHLRNNRGNFQNTSYSGSNMHGKGNNRSETVPLVHVSSVSKGPVGEGPIVDRQPTSNMKSHQPNHSTNTQNYLCFESCWSCFLLYFCFNSCTCKIKY